MAKEDIIIGVAAGVAIAALAPLTLFFGMSRARGPLIRALARGGQVLSENTRETVAEFQEIVEDFVAEMREPQETVAPAAAAAAAVGSATNTSETASKSAGPNGEATAV